MHRRFNTETCPFSQATYKLYNVGGATAVRIVTTGNNVRVWRNDASGDLGLLSRASVLETSSNAGDIFYCCEPIFGSGERGSSDVSLVPEYLAANTLATTMSRYGGISIDLYSLSATSASIHRNGSLVNTIALTPGSVSNFTQSGGYTGGWRVDANGLVIGAKRDDNGNGDSCAMVAPANQIVGWASSVAYIAKESGTATPETYAIHSHLGSINDTLATSYDVINSADLPHNTAQDNYYDPRVGLVSIGTSGINLFGNSRADSDGGNDTALIPTSLMRRFHKIPQPSEFVAINSLSATPIEVRDPSGSLITTLTPTKVNANASAPYSVRYGTPNNQSNIPVGTEFYSSAPIQVVFQTKGGGAFGSDDDESNNWGWDVTP